MCSRTYAVMNYLDHWLRLWHSNNTTVRKRALKHLLEYDYSLIGAEVWNAFNAMFIGELYEYDQDLLDRELRRRIIDQLARSGDVNLVLLLLPQLSNENPLVRAVACKILGGLNDWEATMPVAELLTDPVPYVRYEAC